MSRYIFNLEIKPNCYSRPLSEKETGRYDTAVRLLEELGFIGEFHIHKNGRMGRGFKEGLEVRRGGFDVVDNERDIGILPGAQSAHFHYESGRLDYIAQRRYGIFGRRRHFLVGVARAHELKV